MEAWTEVNLVPVRVRDEELLENVEELLQELRDEIATWFFFWEPDLRLRLRWLDGGGAGEQRARLAATLDRWKASRRIWDWYAGAHGVRELTYVGEADHYGPDIWPRLQQDWMNGSELALALIGLDRAGRLPHAREYYWQRHVHLFTNQLLGTWEVEIEACLAQALGCLRLGGTATPRAKTLLGELEEFR